MPDTNPNPSTLEVDFYTWQRDFYDIGGKKREGPDPRPVRLDAAVGRVAAAIAAHVNGQHGQAWPGHREIARTAQVAIGTVDKAIPILEAAGWLLVDRSRPRKPRYRLGSPVAAVRAESSTQSAASDDLLTRSSMTHSVGQNYEENYEPKNTTKRSTSTASRKREQPKVEAKPMTEDWQPNDTNVRKAAEYELPLDALVVAFRTSALAIDKTSTSWDRDFGGLLRAIKEGTAGTSYPWFDVDSAIAGAAVDEGLEILKGDWWQDFHDLVADRFGPVKFSESTLAKVEEVRLKGRAPEDVIDMIRLPERQDRVSPASETASPASPLPEGENCPENGQEPPETSGPAFVIMHSTRVADDLTWLEQRLGSLSDDERHAAADRLAAGVRRSEVWTDIENMRESARIAG